MAIPCYDFASFGMLLRDFRTRRHLTQQQLAETIGVHRSAVNRWEQGAFLPKQKGIVLELARHLRLDDQETYHLLEASLTGLAPHWSVPLPRNPYFTGREDILLALHRQLLVDHAIALTQSLALSGLGGIGKTQIALEYAYQYALEYSAIFWIEAEAEEQIIASLLHIAETLQLPEREDTDERRVIAAVQRWLSTHERWLLIWDNVEDLALVNRFLPARRSGALLTTTRCRALGTFAQGLELLPMDQEEGTLLLLRRAKVLAPEATKEEVQQFASNKPEQYIVAEQLVAVLGGLPLALDQAGAYIEETGGSFAGYMQRYEQQRAFLLDRRGDLGQDHPQSVTTTIRLSVERVEREQHMAADFLRVCALLHADAIPEELFLDGAMYLGSTLEPLVNTPSFFDQVCAILQRFSLVQRHPETQILFLHRLVQVVIRESMSEQEQAIWQQRVLCALNALFPEKNPENTGAILQQCERLLSHVLRVTALLTDQEGGPQLAQLLWKTADYLHERAQYGAAEPLYQRAVRVGIQALGELHPFLAYPLVGLAYLYQQQGKPAQAEPLFQRALQLREQALGPHHPLLAFPLMGLAILAEKQGKLEQAECFRKRALQLREQALGPHHPLVAITLNDLAILYKNQGKFEQAQVLYERALAIQTRVLGPDHHQLVRVLYNLAHLYRQQGKYEQAESLFQRALRIGEQTWGPEHPNVSYPLDGLAELYIEQGKYEQAEPLSRRTLSLLEQAWGSEHMLLAYPLHNLAILAQRQGKHEQAERLLRRALRIAEQELGPEHPKTIAVRALYAQLLQKQAEHEKKASSELETDPEKDRGQAERSTRALSSTDTLQEFLDVCCELHPRAWCRSADLWQAYTQWVEDNQERYSLSRAAFIAQLKRHGCRADRTMTARIWRGIALIKNET